MYKAVQKVMCAQYRCWWLHDSIQLMASRLQSPASACIVTGHTRWAVPRRHLQTPLVTYGFGLGLVSADVCGARPNGYVPLHV